MDILLLILAGGALLFWTASAVALGVGFRRLPSLADAEPLADGECPTLSIVVPACNEADTVEPAMRSLLRLDYPRLEILAVEDRSTDGTAAILERLAAEDPRLRLLRVTALPEGWLGKNHALHRGSELASGEWLLFTDADVHFEPDALRRALAVAVRLRVDHLVVFPQLVARGFWEHAFVSLFVTMFNLRYRTWEASRKRGGYAGVGAFNLIRSDVYRRLGGHRSLRMEVIDDVKLGKLVKSRGFRQAVAVASGRVRVRWAAGLRGLVHVLTKNAFAGMDYSWGRVLLSTAGLMAANLGPAAALALGSPAARGLAGGALLAMAATAACQRRLSPASPAYALAWPLTTPILLFTIYRSGFLAERQGGIVWRGTFYPLAELRRRSV